MLSMIIMFILMIMMSLEFWISNFKMKSSNLCSCSNDWCMFMLLFNYFNYDFLSLLVEDGEIFFSSFFVVIFYIVIEGVWDGDSLW